MVVIACVLILTGLALLRPRLALLYIFFSFSFEQLLRTRPPDVVGATGALPPMRFSQVVTLLLFGMLILMWLQRQRMPRPGWPFWLFMGYVAMNMLSQFYSSAPEATRRQMTIVFLIVVTLLTFNYWTRDKEQAGQLVLALCAGASLHFAWSLLQLAAYIVFGWKLGYVAPGMADYLLTRTFGWMFEPNWLGLLIVAVYPWFLAIFDYTGRFKLPRWVAIAAMALLLITLILNQSRFAWIAVGLQTVLWALMSSEHVRRYFRRAVIWSLPAIVAAIVGWFFLPATLRESLIGRFVDFTYISEGRGSATVRLVNYRQLLEMARESPWIGRGAGTWGDLLGTSLMGTAPTTTYLYILVEVGIIGLALFLLAIMLYLRRLWLARRYADPQLRLYLSAAVLGVIGVFLAGWFVDVKSTLAYYPLFGFYLGLARLALMPAAQAVPVPVAVQQGAPA